MTKAETLNRIYVDSIKTDADKLKVICEKIIAEDHAYDDMMGLITKLKIRAQSVISDFDKLSAIIAHFGGE